MDGRYDAFSLVYVMFKLRAWIFGVQHSEPLVFGLDTAAYVLLGVVAVSLAVVARRIAKLEVVG